MRAFTRNEILCSFVFERVERARVGKVGVAVHAVGGASQRCVEDFKHTVSYSGGRRETAPYWIVYCKTSDAMSRTVFILIQCV
ncbi:hypothetical protein QQF64_015370 [Cirrhinus molitorella]|uniref:Uncharacterized protein n=1 Tax=Cirrhinus molitorella TaxID=172907 RepID=A0ABR3NUQ5_9TELE